MFTLANKIQKISNVDCNRVKGKAMLGSPTRRCPDINKLENKLGKQSFVSLDEGIQKTLSWYKSRLADRYE